MVGACVGNGGVGKIGNLINCIEWGLPLTTKQLSGGVVINAPTVAQNGMNGTQVPVCDFKPDTDDANKIATAKPTIQMLVEVGDVVATEDMRISLGNFGGSFWFRAATDGHSVCSAAGNGAGESMDKYLQTIEIQEEMVQNDRAINDNLKAYLKTPTNVTLKAYTDAVAERGLVAKRKESYREGLSPADKAQSNSAIHCASMVVRGYLITMTMTWHPCLCGSKHRAVYMEKAVLI